MKTSSSKPKNDTVVTYTHCLIESAKRSTSQSMFPDDSQSTIILSVLAVESFFNEMESTLQHFSSEKLPSKLTALLAMLHEVEKCNGSLRLKIALAYYILGKKTNIRGLQPFQDFAILIDIRNSLVHPRPISFSSQTDSFDTHHNIVKYLVSRKVIEKPTADSRRRSWRYYALNQQVSKWSYDVTCNLIMDIIGYFPKDYAFATFGMLIIAIKGAEFVLKHYEPKA
jgi:hypothetical protein